MKTVDHDQMACSVMSDLDLHVCLGPIKAKKNPVFPLTRPTLLFVADPAIFITILKKIKRFFHLLTLIICMKILDKI